MEDTGAKWPLHIKTLAEVLLSVAPRFIPGGLAVALARTKEADRDKTLGLLD